MTGAKFTIRRQGLASASTTDLVIAAEWGSCLGPCRIVVEAGGADLVAAFGRMTSFREATRRLEGVVRYLTETLPAARTADTSTGGAAPRNENPA